MAFPMVGSRGLDGQKEAVAVGRQSCDASLCLLPCRLWRPSEHCQLREFRVEIDDAGRFAVHVSLHNHVPVPLQRAASGNVALQFNCRDLRFWRLLERFRGTQLMVLITRSSEPSPLMGEGWEGVMLPAAHVEK